jgi:hypothetical protein
MNRVSIPIYVTVMHAAMFLHNLIIMGRIIVVRIGKMVVRISSTSSSHVGRGMDLGS